MLEEYLDTFKRYIRIILHFIGKWMPQVPNRLIIKRFSSEDAHIFFGYYDISPFSKNDKYILAQKTSITNRPPLKNDLLSVGYFNIDDNNKFIELGKTSTWNWQQGSRIQWFNKDKQNEEIIYNKIISGKYGSVVQNVSSGEIIREYNSPIYSIPDSGKYAITLDFGRLGVYRPGYGYINYNYKNNEKAPKDDGMWLLDMDTGNVELLFSIDKISKIESQGSMKNAIHYFNHPCVNINGDRFLFLHIWIAGIKRFTRLLTSDIYGKNICVLNNQGLSSHYCWKTNTQILSYALEKDNEKGFFIYEDLSDKVFKYAWDFMKEDGHPTFSIKGKVVCDTYPNRFSQQLLYTYDESRNDYRKILSFFNPLTFKGETRCDLHPRWNYNGNKICVDSPKNSGLRSMHVISDKG